MFYGRSEKLKDLLKGLEESMAKQTFGYYIEQAFDLGKQTAWEEFNLTKATIEKMIEDKEKSKSDNNVSGS